MFENCAEPGPDATVDEFVNAILREINLLLEEHEAVVTSIRERSSGREEEL